MIQILSPSGDAQAVRHQNKEVTSLAIEENSKPELKNSDVDRNHLDLWLNFWKFVLGTVVLGIVTTLLNNKIQEREVELKELDQLGKFANYALEEEVGVRRRFAQYFSNVTRSKELREGWQRYEAVVNKEYEEKQAETKDIEKLLLEAQNQNNKEKVLKLQAQLNSLRSALSVTPTSASNKVFIQITSENQRELANQIMDELQRKGMIVPGIEKVNVGSNKSEVRYFNADDKQEAELLKSTLNNIGVSITTSYISGYRVPRKQFEIWLASVK
jgi:hypothetical protein